MRMGLDLRSALRTMLQLKPVSWIPKASFRDERCPSGCDFDQLPCDKLKKKMSGTLMTKVLKRTERQMPMWKDSRGVKDFPPECCPECPDLPFDLMYYCPSNKCRKYQRTWWGCRPRRVPKLVCLQCDAIPPEIMRRCRPYVKTCCAATKRGSCNLGANLDCPILPMPCCRAGRVPPSCKKPEKCLDCKKIKCPFPSYSECCRKNPANVPQRPYECRCRAKVFTCDANRYLDRMQCINAQVCGCPTCKFFNTF